MNKKIIATIILITSLLITVGCNNTQHLTEIEQETTENIPTESTVATSSPSAEPEKSEVAVIDSNVQTYEDDFCESYTIFNESGDFTNNKTTFLSENNLGNENLIETHSVNTGVNNIKTELYYDKDLNQYYFTEEFGNYLIMAKIKQISSHSEYFDEAYDNIVIPNPYNVLSTEGNNGENYVSNYREEKETDNNNNIIKYNSYGIINDKADDGETSILKAEYEYNEEGVLTHYAQYQNSTIWGTQFSSRNYFFDSNGNPLFLSAYLTHGSADYTYIYNDESTPQYIILTDAFFGGVVMYEYPDK